MLRGSILEMSLPYAPPHVPQTRSHKGRPATLASPRRPAGTQHPPELPNIRHAWPLTRQRMFGCGNKRWALALVGRLPCQGQLMTRSCRLQYRCARRRVLAHHRMLERTCRGDETCFASGSTVDGALAGARFRVAFRACRRKSAPERCCRSNALPGAFLKGTRVRLTADDRPAAMATSSRREWPVLQMRSRM